GGKARSESNGMLFGDADIEAALREFLAEHIETRARGHGGSYADDLVVLLSEADQLLAEHFRIARRTGFRLGLLARDHVELRDAVILVVGDFGGLIALALLRDDVHEDRPVLHV